MLFKDIRQSIPSITNEANIGIRVDQDEIEGTVDDLTSQMQAIMDKIKASKQDRLSMAFVKRDEGMQHFAKSVMRVSVKDKSQEIPVYITPSREMGQFNDPISGGAFFWFMNESLGNGIYIDYNYEARLSWFDKAKFKDRIMAMITHEVAHAKDTMFRNNKFRKTAHFEGDNQSEYINDKGEVIANIPAIIQELRPYINKSPEVNVWRKGKTTLGKLVLLLMNVYSSHWHIIKWHLTPDNKKVIIKKVSEFVDRELRSSSKASEKKARRT